MTTNELKSYIDRILGNNIRLLLPSYWWKRAFGAVIDKVDEKAEKSDFNALAQGVTNEIATLGGLVNELNATTALKAEYTYVDAKVAKKADKEYVDNAFAQDHVLMEFNIEDDMNLTVTYVGMGDGSDFHIDENGYLTLK